MQNEIQPPQHTMATVNVIKNPLNEIIKRWKDSPSDTHREKINQLAKTELRETKGVREQALEQMRRWIAKNEDIRNVRNDDAYLLRFLRAKKFSVPMAQQMLVKWIYLRRYFPELCRGLDCMHDDLSRIIDEGYIFVSPIRDSNGRRVIFYNVKKFDAVKYGPSEMGRLHFLTYETLLESEDDQVLGFTHVADCEGLTANYITKWSPTVFARIVRQGEQSLPMRHKEIHLFNVPKPVKYVYDFAKSKLSPKINSRITLHTEIDSLHSAIVSKCLPKEYGGVYSMSEMIAEWKKELVFRRSTVATLEAMEIVSDKARFWDTKDSSNCLPGSFRKLDID